MTITTDQIKKLRMETKAGVMDVRKALEESKGDMAKAKQWLAKKGLDKAAKKADRETGDGRIATYVHAGARIGAMVKLACETDFVSATDEFEVLGKEIAMQVASMDPKDVKELLAQTYIRDSKKTIDDLVKEAIAKLGENIQIIEFVRMAI
ncbi:translation elongation factor Ts [Candidatus Beckwithbacteria bacterium]|nr:translation elongation factor Ts [Candidatus Beckwithbacteria bacterium]